MRRCTEKFQINLVDLSLRKPINECSMSLLIDFLHDAILRVSVFNVNTACLYLVVSVNISLNFVTK